MISGRREKKPANKTDKTDMTAGTDRRESPGAA